MTLECRPGRRFGLGECSQVTERRAEGAWIYLTPRVNPESVRCDCNGVSLNLKLKPK
jgi:hypothetical protein